MAHKNKKIVFTAVAVAVFVAHHLFIVAGKNQRRAACLQNWETQVFEYTPFFFAIKSCYWGQITRLERRKSARLVKQEKNMVMNHVAYRQDLPGMMKHKSHASFRSISETGDNIYHYLAGFDPKHLFSIFAYTPDKQRFMGRRTLDIADTIYRHNKDADIPDIFGIRPLHIAAYNDFWGLVDWFIKKGGKVDSKDAFGNTPLHYAVLGGASESVEILVSNGAIFKAENNDAMSPCTILIAIEKSQLTENLKKHCFEVGE